MVVPTWNEGKYLELLLASLQKQTQNSFEVVVADSGSDDQTADVAARYGARLVQGPRSGPGEGRNRGAREAKGDVVVFLDSDCVADPRLIEGVEEACKDPAVIGGAFRFLPLDGRRIDRLLYRMANIYQEVMINLGIYHNAGYGFFYRKKVFEELGGMREDFVLNETHDLAMRTHGKGRFVYLETPVYTSMRRYRKFGYFETVMMVYVRSTIYYYLTKKTPGDKFEFKPAR